MNRSKVAITIRAYIGHLGANNCGYNVGKWVNLPAGNDEINEVLTELSEKAARIGEFTDEFLSFDVDTEIKGIRCELVGSGIEKLNNIAKRLNALKWYQIKDVEPVMAAAGTLENALNVLEGEDYHIFENVENAEDLGKALHEEGLLPFNIPESLERYIDFESIGNECLTGCGWKLVKGGKAVFIPY